MVKIHSQQIFHLQNPILKKVGNVMLEVDGEITLMLSSNVLGND